MNFMAIDIGTTTMKAGVFNPEGDMLAFASHESQNIEDSSQDFYWQSTKEAIIKCLRKLEAAQKNQIKAISISTHTDTVFSLDREGRDVIPVVPWLNDVGKKESQEIMDNFDSQSMFKITGQPVPSNVFFGVRISWLKNRYPALIKKVWKFMQIMDFILFKLTGQLIAEPTVYDGSYLLNINDKSYYKPILEFIGIDEDKLPPIVPSGTSLGKIDRGVAESLGLPAHTEVIVGAMDQNCSSLGAGNVGKKIVTITTGTVMAAMVNTDQPIFDYNTKMPVYNNLISSYCLLPWSPLGGLCLKWFKDKFLTEGGLQAKPGNIYSYMDELAEKIIPGSEGLITLPFISGVMSPFNNDRAKAVFFGISLEHGIGHFVRSILESNAFMVRLYIELFKKMGIPIEEIRILGGGARSSLWNQITADVTGIRIKAVGNPESSLLGAAMIAAVGSGYYRDYHQAGIVMVGPGKEYKPRDRLYKVYEYNYYKFLKLYESNINVF